MHDVRETCDLGIPYLGLGLALGLGIRSRVRAWVRCMYVSFDYMRDTK